MKKIFYILFFLPGFSFGAATKMATVEGKVISFDAQKIEIEAYPKKQKVSFERKYLDPHFKNIHAGDWIKAYVPTIQIIKPEK